jgi:hypothetical protein
MIIMSERKQAALTALRDALEYRDKLMSFIQAYLDLDDVGIRLVQEEAKTVIHFPGFLRRALPKEIDATELWQKQIYPALSKAFDIRSLINKDAAREAKAKVDEFLDLILSVINPILLSE